MNIKSFTSASRNAAIAAIAVGAVGFGASATAMAATTGGVGLAPAATTAQLISPAQPTTRTAKTAAATAKTATPTAKTAAATGCQRITFTVQHNDTASGLTLPQGPYVVWSSNMSCKAASADFTDFLNNYWKGTAPGWTSHQEAPGYGSYTNAATGESFSVGHMADQ